MSPFGKWSNGRTRRSAGLFRLASLSFEREQIGKSLSEPDKVDIARQALEKAKAKGVKFLLPVDTYVVENFDFKTKTVSPGKARRL